MEVPESTVLAWALFTVRYDDNPICMSIPRVREGYGLLG